MSDYNEFADHSNGGSSGPTETPAGIPASRRVSVAAPSIKIRPRTMLDFEEIVEFRFNERIDYEQNIRGNDNGYDGQYQIKLKNPHVAKGELWESTDEEANADRWKLVGQDDPAKDAHAEQVDGGFQQVGITLSGNKFIAEQYADVDGDEEPVVFGEPLADMRARADDDYINEQEDAHDEDDLFVTLYVGGDSVAQRLGRLFDTLGYPFAHYEAGEEGGWDDANQVQGLMEVPYNYFSQEHTNSEDGYPRVARTPDLRQDMIGQAGRILMHFADEAYMGNLPKRTKAFKMEAPGEAMRTDDGDLVQLSMLDEDDEHAAPPKHGCSLAWHTVEKDRKAAGDGSTDENDSEMGGDPTSDDAQAGGGGTKDENESSTADDSGPDAYDELDKTGQSFVDVLVDPAEPITGNDIDFDAKAQALKESDGLDPSIDGQKLREGYMAQKQEA